MTLIEVMVVIAVLAVVTTLAIGGFGQLVARAGPQNAASDFIAQLNVARMRATQTGNDVWVVVYPRGGPAGRQRGAWFLYEDVDGQFGDFLDASPGAFNYRDHFSPTNTSSTSTTGKLLKAQLIADYSAASVTFGYNRQFAFKAPFTPLSGTSTPTSSVACSICTPGGTFTSSSRGAVVFKPDGSARFFAGDGTRLADRSASFALQGTSGNQLYLFAVAASTGFIGFYQR